ncbi:MAG: ATP synthase F0 subunit B [Deltaproteobacteria bacterium]|nr:ATP synthase F0 subunit B [Deltaproteobacteria bacterium]MBW2421402.1 ATP synthase F0 subunit B [Deltaproteobacteria bacterium]
MKPDKTLWLGKARRSSAAVAACIVAPLLTAAPAQASGGLSLAPEPPVLVTLLVGFVLLIFPLNKVIFKPLFAVVDERNAKIEGARHRAAKLEQDADTAIKKYRGAIREAREDGESARRVRLESARSEQGSITGDARSEAEQEIARSRAEVAVSLEEARATLRGATEDLAQVAAERILGRTIS